MIAGIEIAPGALRAVCLGRYRRGRKPDAAHEVPLPPLPDAGEAAVQVLSDALGGLMERIKTSKLTCGVAVPTSWCRFRVASFPYRSSSRIARTLDYALEDRLPRPTGEYAIAPMRPIVRAGDRGARVLAAACDADRVRAVLQAFGNVGLEPCILQPAAVALAGYLDATSARASENGTLVVRLGDTSGEIAVVRDGEVIACQALRIGSQDADEIAERVRLALYAGQMADGETLPKSAVILAQENQRKALSQPLRHHLGVDILDGPEADSDGASAAAWGVAAQAAASAETAPNLRAGAFAYPPSARRPKRLFAAVLALCAAAVGLGAVYTARLAAARMSSLGSLQRQEKQVFEEVTGLRGRTPTLAHLRSAVVQAKKEAERPRRDQIRSCLRSWTELMGLVPKRSGITFKLIDIDQQRIVIEGWAPIRERALRFRQRLAASKVFLPDARFTTQSREGRSITFTMELRYGK